jgi:2-oxoglutarate dehydrogenase complex dehydrogenase (E1) component-like enzyme
VTPTASIDSAGTASLAFLEELFDRYQEDPASVPPDWRAYFDAWAAAGQPAPHGQPVAAPRPATGNGAVGW